MNLLLRCKECLGDVKLNNEDLYKLSLRDSDYATCWTCKYCKTRHVVQIDNDKTDMMVKKLTKIMAKMASRRSRGLKIPSETKRNYLNLVDELNKERAILKNKYSDIDVEAK